MSGTYQAWDANLYDTRHRFVFQHGESLLELLAAKPGERILDLGCGTGHLTARLAENGSSVVGLDSSAEMLTQARAAYPSLEFIQGDARNFRLQEPVDAVFSNAVLHWIHEPMAVIRCVRKSLKPKGRFVAEFGGKGNVQTLIASMRLTAAKIGMQLAEPLWYFPSVGEYAALLEEEGFEVSFAALFDRPTLLEGPEGLKDWVRMFGRRVLDQVPTDRREEFMTIVEDAARPKLFREGVWFADYRRLRVVAVRSLD